MISDFQSEIFNRKSEIGMGGQRVSNPQPPDPQSGALPLSYGHHVYARHFSTNEMPSQK
jgi:hypothetical protein